MKALERAERWLLQPGPASQLGWLRLAVGAYALAWLAVTTPELRRMGRFDAARFEPVGAAAWLGLPAPSPLSISALLVVAAASGVAFTVGWRHRWTAPLFALALLVLTSYQNSWGKLLHTENLLVLHVVVLAVSPAADARSWSHRGVGTTGREYGWPVRVMALATVWSYLAAGITKVQVAGLDWFDPENLRNWVAYDLVRKELFGDPYLPVAVPALEHPWVFAAPMLFTLLVELAAPVVLLRRRLAVCWAIAAWSLHAGVLVAMAVAFPYHLTGLPLLAVVAAAPRHAAAGHHRRANVPNPQVRALPPGCHAADDRLPRPPWTVARSNQGCAGSRNPRSGQ